MGDGLLWVWVIVGGIVVIGGGQLVLSLLLGTAGMIDFLSEFCKRPISTLLLVLAIAFMGIGVLASIMGFMDGNGAIGISGIGLVILGIFLWFKSSTWGPKVAQAVGGKQKSIND